MKTDNTNIQWFEVAKVSDFPDDVGVCSLINGKQIAIYNFDSKSSWYASQNMCPDTKEMVLGRGLLGTHKDIPKVACPLHKETFSLLTGESLSGEDHKIEIYPVIVEEETVYVGLKK